MTVRDLISGAFRLLGVIAAGEQASADEAQDALASLNDLIDSWKLERLMVYTISGQNFPLTPGKKAYTMGPGGDFNVERPVKLDQVSLLYQANQPNPIVLPVELINLDQYQAIGVPDTLSPIPLQVYDDGGFPLRTLSFYPVPAAAITAQIFTWGLVDGFPDINQTIALPPGYQRALRFNLALELAPEYGKQLDPTVVARAVEAKATIKSANIEPLYMRCDEALVQTSSFFNWLTGN